MKSRLSAGLSAVCAAAFLIVAAGSIHAAASAKPAANLIEVNTCPVSGGHSSAHDGGFEVVGKYKAYFCCAGCKSVFDKLTSAQKLAKVQVAEKADKAAK